MELETFNFPNHTFRIRFPEDQASVKFGRGYTFTAAPRGPSERVFTLNMMGLTAYLDENDLLEPDINPQRNFKTFYDFWNRHRTHKAFLYKLDGFGDVKVRFNKPVDFPTAIEGGSGVFPAFEIELIEDHIS